MLMVQGIPVDEYFKYHAPQTEERRRRHEVANTACLQLFRNLYRNQDQTVVKDLLRDFNALISHLMDDHLCRNWALKSLESAGQAALNQDSESLLMHVQQVRMFVNQGITVDELKLLANNVPLS